MPADLQTAFLSAVALIVLVGCTPSTDDRGAVQTNPATDAAYLTSPLWNDGQAEMAFYRVRRSQSPYGEREDQVFLLGSYLVKHDYDPRAEAKAASGAAETVSAFKYALFYEFESGSYEYKRSYVVNARQADLRPLKHSFNSFDWCSNLYEELAFDRDGRVEYLKRSDDYGNHSASFDYVGGTYPPALVPLLVRSMDFRDDSGAGKVVRFGVLLESGEVVTASAERFGVEPIETEAGRYEAERIEVTYDGELPSPFAEEADRRETYWRGTGADRLLVALEATTGRYRVELIEAVRSPYWEENVYDELVRVQSRP
jgi:hypothetical protein